MARRRSVLIIQPTLRFQQRFNCVAAANQLGRSDYRRNDDTCGIGIDPNELVDEESVQKARERQHRAARKLAIAKVLELYPPRPRDVTLAQTIPIVAEELQKVQAQISSKFPGVQHCDFIPDRLVASGHTLRRSSSSSLTPVAQALDAEEPFQLPCHAHIVRYHVSQIQGVAKLLPLLQAAHRSFCSNGTSDLEGHDVVRREYRSGGWQIRDDADCAAALRDHGIPQGATPIPFWVPVTAVPAQTRLDGRPFVVHFRTLRPYFHSRQLRVITSPTVAKSLQGHYWATSGKSLPFGGDSFKRRNKDTAWSSKTKCWFRVDELEELGLIMVRDDVTFEMVQSNEFIVHRVSDTTIFRKGTAAEILQAFPLPRRDVRVAESVGFVHVLFAGPRWESFPCNLCTEGLDTDGSSTLYRPAEGTIYIATCAATQFGLLETYAKTKIHREEVTILGPSQQVRDDELTPTAIESILPADNEVTSPAISREEEDEEDLRWSDEDASQKEVTVDEVMSTAKHLTMDFMQGLIAANKSNKDATTTGSVLPATTKKANGHAEDVPIPSKIPRLEKYVRENYMAVTLLQVRGSLSAVNASHVDFVSLQAHPESRIS